MSKYILAAIGLCLLMSQNVKAAGYDIPDETFPRVLRRNVTEPEVLVHALSNQVPAVKIPKKAEEALVNFFREIPYEERNDLLHAFIPLAKKQISSECFIPQLEIIFGTPPKDREFFVDEVLRLTPEKMPPKEIVYWMKEVSTYDIRKFSQNLTYTSSMLEGVSYSYANVFEFLNYLILNDDITESDLPSPGKISDGEYYRSRGLIPELGYADLYRGDLMPGTLSIYTAFISITKRAIENTYLSKFELLKTLCEVKELDPELFEYRARKTIDHMGNPGVAIRPHTYLQALSGAIPKDPTLFTFPVPSHTGKIRTKLNPSIYTVIPTGWRAHPETYEEEGAASGGAAMDI